MEKKIFTADDILARIRGGRDADLKIQIGDYEAPCRVLPSSEEQKLIMTARESVRAKFEKTNASPETIEQAISDEVMKSILSAGCTVKGTPYLAPAVLAMMSSVEISVAFDAYQSAVRMVNPKFESLSRDEIAELISAAKKKSSPTSDFYTWQLAAIGKFFLEEVLPKVSEPGS